MSFRIEPVLVGRQTEIAAISSLLERVYAGSSGAVLLEGEAGIGKSRLIAEVVEQADALGLTILQTSADEGDRWRTFGPLFDAFGEASSNIANILDRSATATAPERRIAVIDELASAIDNANAATPVCLILDDLHWADVETLRVVRALIRRTRTLAVAFVLATRPSPANLELERLIGSVRTSGGAHIALAPLDEEAVASLTGRYVSGEVPKAFRDRIASARGNPFFLTEILAAGHDEDERPELPEDLRRTVLRAMAHLSEDAKAIVRLASLLGPTIDIADLAAVDGRTSIELVTVIDEAVKGRVLEDRGDALAFRHDLVREAIHDDMPEAVRKDTHRVIARALVAAGAPARRIASHIANAASPGDGEAVSWLRRAAAEEAQRSPLVAADLLDRALQLLDVTDPSRDRLFAARAQALAWAGKVVEASELAADALSRLDDPELAAELRASLAESLFFRGRLVEAGDLFEHAAADAPVSQRGLLLAEAGLSRAASGQLQRAEELTARALAECETTDDPRARSLAIAVRVLLAGAHGNYAELELSREAVQVADDDATGETHRYGARLFLGYALIETDRFDEAITVLRRGIRLDEENGVAWSLPCYHTALGVAYFMRGEWDDAVAEFETAEALLDDMGSALLGPQAHGHLAFITAHRGDTARAEHELALGEADIAEAGPQIGAEWLIRTRAVLAEDAGDMRTAVAIVSGAWGFAEMMGFRLAYKYFGPTYVRMALTEGDAVTARSVVEAVEALAITATTSSAAGTAMLCRGMLEADTPKLLEAVEALRATGRPMELAVACEEAGASSDDPEVSGALRKQALEIYELMGAQRDIHRASGSDGSGGAKRRATKRRPVTGWESLSRTERRVVALVAEGLSNAAIAERMFVSSRTVETHLYHVFRKLHVSSRLELAVRAASELGEDTKTQ